MSQEAEKTVVRMVYAVMDTPAAGRRLGIGLSPRFLVQQPAHRQGIEIRWGGVPGPGSRPLTGVGLEGSRLRQEGDSNSDLTRSLGM